MCQKKETFSIKLILSSFSFFEIPGNLAQSSGSFAYMQESLIKTNLLWKLFLYKILQGSVKLGPQ